MSSPAVDWESFAAGLRFHAGRCVHSHSPIARCHACETACPRQAWRLGEEGLDFDTEACDGCGLCVPACPESAIRCTPAPGEMPTGERTWLLACSHASVQQPNVPCLHAVADTELIAQWHRGCREIDAAHVDCETCPRAPTPAWRLASRLERINAALREREGVAMHIVHVQAAAWERSLQRQRKATPDLARRGLFTRIAATPAKPPETRLPVLPDTEAAAPLTWRWQARIDPARCTACDACVRLCLHGALRHENSEEGSAYLSEPRHCTGCALCVDVCTQQAVTVLPWQPAPALLRWPVQEKNCAHCGAPFHQCVDDGQRYCSVCRHARHPRASLRVVENRF